jgi:hypothetical protein
MSADRHVFNFLRRYRKGAGTGEPTTFYLLDPNDGRHSWRVEIMGEAYHQRPSAGPPSRTPGKRDGGGFSSRISWSGRIE